MVGYCSRVRLEPVCCTRHVQASLYSVGEIHASLSCERLPPLAPLIQPFLIVRFLFLISSRLPWKEVYHLRACFWYLSKCPTNNICIFCSQCLSSCLVILASKIGYGDTILAMSFLVQLLPYHEISNPKFSFKKYYFPLFSCVCNICESSSKAYLLIYRPVKPSCLVCKRCCNSHQINYPTRTGTLFIVVTFPLLPAFILVSFLSGLGFVYIHTVAESS